VVPRPHSIAIAVVTLAAAVATEALADLADPLVPEETPGASISF
jgi:hypothetical protein